MGGRGKEIYMVKNEAPALEIFERYDRVFQPIYGSDAKFDSQGGIYIPRWRSVPPGRADPSKYKIISPKSVLSDEARMWKGLETMKPVCLEIVQITEDSGSVEAAIRYTDHILTGTRGKEREQAEAVRARTQFLIDYFQEWEPGRISESDRKGLQEETVRQLLAVGLDSETVTLEEKQKMGQWLIKASKAEDSTGRINQLITMQLLFAVQRRVLEREIAVGGFTVPKYLQISEALVFARSFDRKMMTEAERALMNLLSTVHFRRPETQTEENFGVTRGKMRSVAWMFSQIKLSPYRPAAKVIGERLNQLVGLMEQRNIEGAYEIGLVDWVESDRAAMEQILTNPTYKEVFYKG